MASYVRYVLQSIIICNPKAYFTILYFHFVAQSDYAL